jgi:hypothetical protein
MNVTRKNTRALFYLILFNVVICLLLGFFVPAAGFGTAYFPVFAIEFSVSVIATFVYLVRILSWFKERIAIVAAFVMFTCLLVINIIDRVFPTLLKYSYSNSLGILLEVVGALVAIRSFNVKAAVISAPFRLLGTGIGFMIFPRLMMMFVGNSFHDQLINMSAVLGLLIVLLAICFILKRTIASLTSYPEQPVEIREQ